MRKNHYAAVFVAVLLFVLVWAVFAQNLAAWSDEITHMSVGKGLMVAHQPYIWNFDLDQITANTYTRALGISYMSALAWRLGGESLLTARCVPLIFTLLTFVVYLFYVRRKYNIGQEKLWITALLFFAQAIIIEKSLYVRYYAPLAFLFLLSLILVWEGFERLFQRKKVIAFVLFFIAALLLVFPTLDMWHLQHIPMMILAAVLIILARYPKIFRTMLEFTRKRPWWSLGLFVLILIGAPFAVIIINLLLAYFPIGTRRLGLTFATYWDNIAGLTRFIWAVNICFLGAFAFYRGRKINWDFNSWIFAIGIISGLAFGALNPHNFIFYSRFFYLPVVLVVLGFSGMLGQLVPSRPIRTRLLAVYIVLNLLLLSVNFYFDRSNINKAVDWLNRNTTSSDMLIVFRAEMALHGAEEDLFRIAYPVEPSRDIEDIKKLSAAVRSKRNGAIYFLYTHHYDFKENLYHFTTGGQRTYPTDLYRYLARKVPAENVIGGLRGCGLKKYERKALLRSLDNLAKKGYSTESFVGLHYRIIRGVFRWFKPKK